MNDESTPQGASAAATATTKSTPAVCIFPRQRPAAPSEFQRMRRARSDYIAACRRQGAAGDSGSSLPTPPGSFGLSEDNLRRHANELHQRGWSVDEIESTLAIERAAK